MPPGPTASTENTDPGQTSREMSDAAAGPNSSDSGDNVARLKSYLKLTVDTLRQRNWRATLRSPQLYFGLGAAANGGVTTGSDTVANWSVPTAGDMQDRLVNNSRFFASNHALFAAVLALYFIIADWIILFWIGIVIGAWYLLLTFAEQLNWLPRQIGGITITMRTATVALSVISAAILIIFVGSVFLWVMGATTLVVVGHSLARNPISYKHHDGLPSATSGDNL